jgi:hypothetical protein
MYASPVIDVLVESITQRRRGAQKAQVNPPEVLMEDIEPQLVPEETRTPIPSEDQSTPAFEPVVETVTPVHALESMGF